MAGAGSCDHEALDAQQYSNWTVDYVKDDGCGGCHGTAPDPALASYAAMQAGLTESHRHIFLSTEASPNLTAHSARPDLYGNTHRTGHDSQRARPKPAWDSFAVVWWWRLQCHPHRSDLREVESPSAEPAARAASYASVMTQMDIAANLWGLVHNDTGHGGYYNDLDSAMVMLSRCVSLYVSLTPRVSRLQCFRSGRGI